MQTVLALSDVPTLPDERESVPLSPRACDGCPFAQCTWRLPRTTLYLHVWRQSRILGEPFDVVLRSRVRNSRAIDPAIRSEGLDTEGTRMDARAIGWSLDEIAKRYGARFMHPANAAQVAAQLCPERHAEGE